MSDNVEFKKELAMGLLRSYVECPICLEVPRDGVMLMCVNGHNVCNVCKDKIGMDTTCPQGRCDFPYPPTKNRTIAAIVDDFPFEHSCENFNSGCPFKAVKSVLESHEAECPHRLVPCPCYPCFDYVQADAILEHCRTEHQITERDYGADTNSFVSNRLWKREYSDIDRDFLWDEEAVRVGDAWTIVCCHLERGQVYLWLQAIADGSEASRLKCEITLGEETADRRATTVITAPVYPIDMDSEEIIGDKDCARFSLEDVEAALIEDRVAEENRRNGYCALFPIQFRVVENTE